MEARRFRGLPAACAGWVLAGSGYALAQAPNPGTPPTPGAGVAVAGCRVSLVDQVSLASERQGIVAAIARPGESVAAGQDVARLRDTVLRATLAIAQREAANDVDVRFAEKAAELAELKHQSAVAANAQIAGTVTELELKELRLAADRAGLQREQAEHARTVAQLRLAETQAAVQSLHIAAPLAGRVRAVFKQPGEVVQQGEVIAELVSAARVRVEGDVPLAGAAGVAVGAAAAIRLTGEALPAELASRTFYGTVTFVDEKVEPVSRTVHVAAEVENRDGALRDGLTATMFVAPPSRASAAATAARGN